jgi:hypothetical protein
MSSKPKGLIDGIEDPPLRGEGSTSRLIRFLKGFFLKFIEYIHYLGLILALLMFMEARQTARDSDQTLSASIDQQESLRNLLWVNLLIQRATSFGLMSNLTGDSTFLDKSRTISEALTGYLPHKEANLNNSSVPTPSTLAMATELIRRDVSEFQAMIESPNIVKKKQLIQLGETTGRIGSELNRIESEDWFRLRAHNKKLLSEIKQGHKNLMQTFVLFVTYLIFLGWILDRKKKAEQALKHSEASLKLKTLTLQRAQSLARLGV